MFSQEELTKKIENFITQEKTKRDLSDLSFKVLKSQTTNSIYVTVRSYVNNEDIKISYRFSDHKNSKVKTKIVKGKIDNDFIAKKINLMIKQVRYIRYKVLLNETKL